MGSELEKIKFFKQSIVKVEGGDVYHIYKKSINKNLKFREAYFSSIEFNYVKGWKLHKKMISNLSVPIGEVQFIFVSKDFRNVRKIILGQKNYGRIYVPPNVWFCFKGLSKNKSLILNLSSIEHDEQELEKIKLEKFPLNIKI